MTTNSLPVILVSAADLKTATTVISELIDNEVAEKRCEEAEPSRVWRLVNKYYSAEVRVRALADGAPPPAAPVDAHIIYLSEEEGEDSCTAERRCASAGPAARAPLRLALVQRAVVGDALAAWAFAARYEPVPLLEAGAPHDIDEPFPELYGMERARAALHAHRWPGLALANARRAPPQAEDGSSSDGDVHSQHEDEDGEDAVERAERFAAALGALSAVTALPTEERRARAEEVVAAFCRALGHRLDDW